MIQAEPEIEDRLTEEDSDETTPFQYSITSYGADFVVDGLVSRMERGDIGIPEFQRGYVWSLRDASRFVESLLLGLPVPSIFLSREQSTQRLLVIDGSQRLRTLQYFYQGIWPKTRSEFALKGVQKQFERKTYSTLNDEDRRRLNDSVIHGIIVKQDEPSDDSSSIYYIFERLNTGGLLLTPQEIRAAIYHGNFSSLLNELSRHPAWQRVYGPSSANMRDQELILRFLALYFNAANYKRPMKNFLNTYMAKNKDLQKQAENEIREVFTATTDLVARCIGARAFKPKRALNAAVFDAVMVGIAKRLERHVITSCRDLKERYDALLRNEEFLKLTERATADEDSVSKRLQYSTEAFSTVQ